MKQVGLRSQQLLWPWWVCSPTLEIKQNTHINISTEFQNTNSKQRNKLKEYYTGLCMILRHPFFLCKLTIQLKHNLCTFNSGTAPQLNWVKETLSEYFSTLVKECRCSRTVNEIKDYEKSGFL